MRSSKRPIGHALPAIQFVDEELITSHVGRHRHRPEAILQFIHDRQRKIQDKINKYTNSCTSKNFWILLFCASHFPVQN
ncbi:hypothetical protein BDA96_08G029100 [Sorghum bicolor]|uniref:Uncharacterized protein n=2 Tax=Sorghum bicolor TaxID=4558 RepID=A0A921QCU0_SORBI|nr:hypothetical protein BDA96_08G029100 [Sorghum bicolor]KXG22912.1 hypothetical protein SORBI_3008G026300 [Sorghum bicolor]